MEVDSDNTWAHVAGQSWMREAVLTMSEPGSCLRFPSHSHLTHAIGGFAAGEMLGLAAFVRQLFLVEDPHACMRWMIMEWHYSSDLSRWVRPVPGYALKYVGILF